MPDPEWQEVMWQCERWLSSRRPVSAAESLRQAADALDRDLRPDRYGEGQIVEEFESRLADLLGAQAAALFPSGTMAQQIALRIHCEQRHTRSVAWHPTCHLALHENAGYAHLHGLKAELIGDRDRLIELDDLTRLKSPLGAVLLELPQREIGGQLPEWEDLVAQVNHVKEHGAAVHLDGARIWEAAPYYDRPHSEIAGMFDSSYVSLYKGLLGLSGSVLAGSEDLIDQARVWRRRHGGTLARLFPFVAAALPGLENLVEKMPTFLEHARQIAAALHEVPGVEVIPNRPQTPLFHIHIRGDREVLWQRALDIAAGRGVWLFGPLGPALVPGTSKIEVNIGEPALEIAPLEVAELFAQLTETAV
ncbi:MAG: threonine aldolase family protein [Solirubrobacteraceae bacterium]